MIVKMDIPLSECDLKFKSGKKGEFEGYASVFNGVDSYRDTILPGAFKETISEKSTLPMFINHDSWSIPVGDWVTLKEDDHGLLVTGVVDFNHNDGSGLYSALERKAMDALSIGFRIRKGGASETDDGIRELSDIDLQEISVVNFPADKEARIMAVKADIETLTSLKEAELFLRDSGFSKSAAVSIVSRVLHLGRSDSDSRLSNELATLKARLNSKSATDQLIATIKKAGK